MRITLYFFNVTLLVLGLGFSAFAKDPFAPPQNVQLLYQLIYQRTDGSLPKYKMYMTRSGKPYALLNDTFVNEGEEYEKMKVAKITKKAVVLQTVHGDQKIIVLEGLQSKLKEIQAMIEEGSSND